MVVWSPEVTSAFMIIWVSTSLRSICSTHRTSSLVRERGRKFATVSSRASLFLRGCPTLFPSSASATSASGPLAPWCPTSAPGCTAHRPGLAGADSAHRPQRHRGGHGDGVAVLAAAVAAAAYGLRGRPLRPAQAAAVDPSRCWPQAGPRTTIRRSTLAAARACTTARASAARPWPCPGAATARSR